jgi:hypothetical protein
VDTKFGAKVRPYVHNGWLRRRQFFEERQQVEELESKIRKRRSKSTTMRTSSGRKRERER